MTDYDIIYMVAIISVSVGALLALAVYKVDKNANRNDKHDNAS